MNKALFQALTAMVGKDTFFLLDLTLSRYKPGVIMGHHMNDQNETNIEANIFYPT